MHASTTTPSREVAAMAIVFMALLAGCSQPNSESADSNRFGHYHQQASTLDQSHCETGVLVNGREISPQEQMAMSRIVGHVEQGEYWLDSAGNLGVVGEEAFANVYHGTSGVPKSSSPRQYGHGMTSTAAELQVTTLDGRPMQ